MVTADEFRRAASALPEAQERAARGAPDLPDPDRMFATLSDDGRVGGIKTTKQEQLALIAAAPETFSVPASVGRHGWVSVQLATADPTQVREFLVEAWRQTAPRRLVATYDAG
jgi:hypothetical protein